MNIQENKNWILKFDFTTVQVDPGPDWQGYHLNDEQNGFDLNFVNGNK